MIIKKIDDFIKENNNANYNLIDYSFLSTLTNDEIKKICTTAEEKKVYSVCVLPEYISTVSSFLDDNEIKVVGVIDFPKGSSTTNEKVKEIDKVLVNGADEIDVMINLKFIKGKEWEKIEDEVRTITEFVHKEGKIAKIIIEIGALNFQELEQLCKICTETNVDYIMTSTGTMPNDNSFEEKLEKVKFIRKITPNDTRIKFSGGIRALSQIEQLSTLVDRIGTSVIPV